MMDSPGWHKVLGHRIDPALPAGVRGNIRLAVKLVASWLTAGGQPDGAIPDLLQNIQWKPSPLLWRTIGFHHVELSTVFLVPRSFPVETAVHELAHILDNRLGPHLLASIFGGGPSDSMLRFVGIEPDQFFPRFSAPGYERALTEAGCELNPTLYGRSKGPAEDFAESLQLAVFQPEVLAKSAPLRFEWLTKWKETISDIY
jgi:hypothetical protein